MTDPHATGPIPSVRPVAYPPAPPPRAGRSLLGVLFGMSLLFNLVGFFILAGLFVLVLAVGSMGDGSDPPLRQTFHSGKSAAADKVAVVRIEGVILEGMTEYARKQMEQAAKDDQVKAVVFRINSPGGSITASDELHQRIAELCKGNGDRAGKPAVVSMGSLAASGGYYIAMPVKTLYAERTTVTGSIGVFASFPNVKKLCDDIGVKMEVVKRGEVKDSGSMFKEMTPQERQLWQDMVDQAYEQFLQVVRDGRPAIKDQLKDEIIRKTIKVPIPGTNEEREEPFVRTRVDGGIFTAEEAKKFGLIDHIGFLEDAVKDVAGKAGFGPDYQVITYERPRTLAERLMGVQAPQAGLPLDPARLASAATPRLWYLSPQSELAGLLTAAGR